MKIQISKFLWSDENVCSNGKYQQLSKLITMVVKFSCPPTGNGPVE